MKSAFAALVLFALASAPALGAVIGNVTAEAVPAVPMEPAVQAKQAVVVNMTAPSPVAPAAPAAPVATAVPAVPVVPAVPRQDNDKSEEKDKSAQSKAEDKKAAPLLLAVPQDTSGVKGSIVAQVMGDSCKENGDCKVANSYCKAGACHCAANFVFSDDAKRCLPVATKDNPGCDEARQCVLLLNSSAAPSGPAACVDGKCRCRYDHDSANGTCVLKQARGKACSNDVQCEDLSGGACIQGVCSCTQDYVPAVAANVCLPVQVSVGAACTEPIQCSESMGDLVECKNGECVCVPGARMSNDRSKCLCAGQDEEYVKEVQRCEKRAPAVHQAATGTQQSKGGAGSLQSGLTFVLAVAVFSIRSAQTA